MSKISVTTIAGLTSGGDANKVKIESGDTLQVESNATVGGTLGVTGDLTVDTSTLKVDSSNNRVGIGTTSPAMGLHISGSTSSSNYGMRVVNTDASGYSTIQMGGTDAGIYRNGSSQTQYGGASSLNLITVSGHPISLSTSNTVRMKIDGSGYVTKPNQPMFSISGGPNSYQDGSGNQTVVLHGQSGVFPGDMNIGGHFSYSTGRFTAPIAGNYMFTYTLTSGDTGSHFIELRKNNASQTTVLLYTTQYQSGCHATIYTLAANDYVTAQRRGTGYSVYSAVFSGFLIG